MSSAIALVSVCAAAQCSTALVQSAPEGDVTHRRCGCCTTASAARCPTAHRLLSVAYTAADAYSGSSAAQRSRALTAVSEVKRSSEAWFALGLARVIGTANAKGEFAADRTGLTGARERRLYRYSGVQRAINSRTATAVGPLGSLGSALLCLCGSRTVDSAGYSVGSVGSVGSTLALADALCVTHCHSLNLSAR